MTHTSGTPRRTEGERFLEALCTAFVTTAFLFAYGLCGLAICIEGMKFTFGFSQQGLYMTMALWSMYTGFMLAFVGRVNLLFPNAPRRPFRYIGTGH